MEVKQVLCWMGAWALSMWVASITGGWWFPDPAKKYRGLWHETEAGQPPERGHYEYFNNCVSPTWKLWHSFETTLNPGTGFKWSDHQVSTIPALFPKVAVFVQKSTDFALSYNHLIYDVQVSYETATTRRWTVGNNFALAGTWTVDHLICLLSLILWKTVIVFQEYAFWLTVNGAFLFVNHIAL